MIEIRPRNGRDVHRLASDAVQQPEESRSPVLQFVVLIGVLGMIVLLPVQFLLLPLNLALVDLWNVIALPICWLYLIRMPWTVRLPYIIPMWFIWLGSFIGTLSASDQWASLAVVLKEVYLYVWFVTLAAVFAGLAARDLRRLMLIWVGVEMLHGGLVVAQFLSPDVSRIVAAYAARFGQLDLYRPSGLFENANGAAFFQLTGFVPLLLVRLPRRLTAILALGLLLSVVATGSLGATAGLLVGLIGALIVISILDGRLTNLIKIFVQLAAATILLGGLFYFAIRQYSDFQARLEYTFYGRAENSAGTRFDLWQSGIDVLFSEMPVWGLGPDNFRDEVTRKTLHNDLLAFAVERGVIGILGLVLFGASAIGSAIRLLQPDTQRPNLARPVVVIFLAALLGAVIESQTHQVFHERSLWLVLAMQEAMLFTMLFGRAGAASGLWSGLQSRQAFASQHDFTRG